MVGRAGQYLGVYFKDGIHNIRIIYALYGIVSVLFLLYIGHQIAILDSTNQLLSQKIDQLLLDLQIRDTNINNHIKYIEEKYRLHINDLNHKLKQLEEEIQIDKSYFNDKINLITSSQRQIHDLNLHNRLAHLTNEIKYMDLYLTSQIKQTNPQKNYGLFLSF